MSGAGPPKNLQPSLVECDIIVIIIKYLMNVYVNSIDFILINI